MRLYTPEMPWVGREGEREVWREGGSAGGREGEVECVYTYV